jgi:hypothetical protein
MSIVSDSVVGPIADKRWRGWIVRKVFGSAVPMKTPMVC